MHGCNLTSCRHAFVLHTSQAPCAQNYCKPYFTLQHFTRSNTAQVLGRIVQLALGCALPAVCALWLLRGRLPGLFTSDPGAIRQAAAILPLIIL